MVSYVHDETVLSKLASTELSKCSNLCTKGKSISSENDASIGHFMGHRPAVAAIEAYEDLLYYRVFLNPQ